MRPIETMLLLVNLVTIHRSGCPASKFSVLDASFSADRAAYRHRTGAGGGFALADGPSLRADWAVLLGLAVYEHRTFGRAS